MSSTIEMSTLPHPTGLNQSHESARLHVTGQATYVDDIPTPANCLHAYVGGVDIAAGNIQSVDLAQVIHSPGVVDVITAADVPGHLDIGPVFPGDFLLAKDKVTYWQQPVFAVLARSRTEARQAARLAHIKVVATEPILDLSRSLAQFISHDKYAQNLNGADDHLKQISPSHTIKQGNVQTALSKTANQIVIEQTVGGQEHFYLEGQVSLAVPQEEGGVLVYCSSQHPSEIQKLVAEVLDLPLHQVVVDMRRMGGGFGGKETQAAQWACLAALLAVRNQVSVKLRLARSDDMQLTGKRHGFINQAHIGFDDKGRIQALQADLHGLCGTSPDLSNAIVDRAMFHTDNAYFLPNVHITGHRWFQNTVSHTAFRGFGGPQGMMLAEQAMDDIARHLGCDPLEVRLANLYQTGHTTPYGQDLDEATCTSLYDTIQQLIESSNYWARRQELNRANQGASRYLRGLALTPVKFGISFTVQHLNQAGALVHIYTDGTVQVNHGGTEMGQGLHTKIRQIAASTLGIALHHVKVTATRTDKVPNTSPTAASSGTDLNGQAVYKACAILSNRLQMHIGTHYACDPQRVRLEQNKIIWPTGEMSFAEVVQQAYMARVSLSTTGYYKTPHIYYDREKGKGQPFYYYTCGAAVSEVVVDRITGMYHVPRVDIVHDGGKSINPAIDIGQIEGGFIQGMGWLTSEEVVWDSQGRLSANSGATYKIPAIGDTPIAFNVNLLANSQNHAATIFHSKAVGEPPFMYGISVWSALRDAIYYAHQERHNPPLPTPATPEQVLRALSQGSATLA